MKIKEHLNVPKKDLPAYLKELTASNFTIISNAETEMYHIIVETECTKPEYHMLVLRTILNNVDNLTDEEKNALEYSISSIKTLADMGVIK
jgi:hypothetical protein